MDRCGRGAAQRLVYSGEGGVKEKLGIPAEREFKTKIELGYDIAKLYIIPQI